MKNPIHPPQETVGRCPECGGGPNMRYRVKAGSPFKTQQQKEIDRLRSALERIAIEEPIVQHIGPFTCRICKCSWLPGQPSNHTSDCRISIAREALDG